MIKVILSGGIGAGKTTIARIFEALNIPIYFSDIKAKSLMTTVLRIPLIELLGRESFLENGELNRDYISSQIFANPALLHQINSLIHPAVMDDFLLWSQKQTAPYVIIETALLLESGIDKIADKIIIVTAPLDIRIERASTRDNVSPDKIRQRIAGQSSEKELLQICDYHINTHSAEMLLPLVVDIDTNLREVVIAKKKC